MNSFSTNEPTLAALAKHPALDDPRDANSPKVIQLETAMGAAIDVLPTPGP